jgi:hypothetical protein
MVAWLCLYPVLAAPMWKAIPLCEFLDESELSGISADGQTIAGYMSNGQKTRAFKWTEATGSKKLVDVSWVMWRSANGLPQATPDGDLVDPLGVDSKKMRWVRSISLMQDSLAPRGSFTTVWATGATGDKKIKFGHAIDKKGTQAVIWDGPGDPYGLGDLPGGDFYSEADGISGNGKWIAGASLTREGLRAFVWSKNGGMLELKDKESIQHSTVGNCVSDDGKVIGGETLVDGELHATLWFYKKIDNNPPKYQFYYAEDYLKSIGVTIDKDWKLESVQCISDNGLVIVGKAKSDTGAARVWMATIPAQ